MIWAWNTEPRSTSGSPVARFSPIDERHAFTSSVAVIKARKMYLDAKISKKEMDHLLRADALFRFEETHNSPPPTPPTPARAAAADATAGADIEPIFRGGPPPPPQALSRHRFTDSSTTLSKKKIQQAHNSAKRRLHVQQTRDRWRQNERDLQVANDTKAWERIFAHPQNWEDAKRRGVVTQLCFRGVPPAVRRRAWCAMIGNPLMVTPPPNPPHPPHLSLSLSLSPPPLRVEPLVRVRPRLASPRLTASAHTGPCPTPDHAGAL